MKSLIVISERDNVATTLDALDAGEHAVAAGMSITAREAIPSGHKIALARIPSGAAVVKYGSAIGIATTEIEPGSHVHTHNVASTRGRGDLQPLSEPDRTRVEGRVEGRLAEPSDEASSTPPVAATPVVREGAR